MKYQDQIQREVRLDLSGADLIDLLNGNLKIPDAPEGFANFKAPANACVTFKVPTGGDYSGDVLGISDTHPITITWKEPAS